MLRAAGIAFTEQKLAFNTEAFARGVGEVSPAGLVPVLLDDEFAIWDSLAICEYLADRHPEAGLWPAQPRRAPARSLAAQMHSGFAALRQAMPLNVAARLPAAEFSDAVRQDISGFWISGRTRAQFGQGGPFLFGAFTIADAFYAPVVSRFTTYGVSVTGDARAYMDAVLAHPAMQEWIRDSQAEAAA